MDCQQTFPTEAFLALIAQYHILRYHSHNPLTLLSRTHLAVRVFESCVKPINLPVLVLNVKRKNFQKRSVRLKNSRTIFLWTLHLFELFHLEYHIMVQTRFTKTVLVVALPNVYHVLHLFFLSHLSLANLTTMSFHST